MSKLDKQISKEIKKSLNTRQAKKDRVSNRKGLIEGVDSLYQWEKASKVYGKWEPEGRIGSRRKI